MYMVQKSYTAVAYSLIIRFLIGIFILQETRQRFWLSSASLGQPDVAAAFGLRV